MIDSFIYWIGAFHLVAYGTISAFYVSWRAIERALNFCKLSGIILQWYRAKLKAKYDANRAVG
jgi:hypothetical protein